MAYLRARRSIKLGAGVRLNLNKNSVGVSFGGPGAHVSVNSKGHRTRTVGVPGTGVSYVSRSSAAQHRSRPASSAPAVAPPKPGLFASHTEKAFAAAMHAYLAGNPAARGFHDAVDADTTQTTCGPMFFSGIVALDQGDLTLAATCLERVVSGEHTVPDELMRKYAPGFALLATLNETVQVSITADNVGAILLLAGVYDQQDRNDEAIGLLQQLLEHHRGPYLVLHLAQLYAKVEDWDEVIHLTAGITNQDDLTLLIRILQAQAMSAKGLDDAALEVLKDTLRSTKRDRASLQLARYRRAQLCLKLGKRAMAKRDLSRLYADDPTYEDVGEQLQQLS